jgi:SAM-dependent methyltransferase
MEPISMIVARAEFEEKAEATRRLVACRVCGGEVAFALTAHEMMLGARDAYDYFECEECGCLQIASIPSDIDRFYRESYYTSSQSTHRQSSGHCSGLRRRWTRLRLGDGRLARILSGRRYARFEWFRRTRTGLRDEILDVGCGSGRLLFRLQTEGFERLTGIDLRLEKTRSESVIPRFERVSLEDHHGCYQLVMAHHSFEHMSDPVRAFAAFGRLVASGGYLLLRLPVADCWARRHYGADWVQLDAPRHFHLHTRRSIEGLADRSGFRVVHVADDSGPFQIWGSELYRRDVSLVEAGRGGRSALGLRERLAARFRAHSLSRQGLGDQACFYLRRED